MKREYRALETASPVILDPKEEAFYERCEAAIAAETNQHIEPTPPTRRKCLVSGTYPGERVRTGEEQQQNIRRG